MPRDIRELLNEFNLLDDVHHSSAHIHREIEEEFDEIDINDFTARSSAQLYEESHAYR